MTPPVYMYTWTVKEQLDPDTCVETLVASCKNYPALQIIGADIRSVLEAIRDKTEQLHPNSTDVLADVTGYTIRTDVFARQDRLLSDFDEGDSAEE